MKKILLVDDSIFLRSQLKDLIYQRGHQVVGEAENGEEAFKKYKELHPDLVFLDVTMPVMDGIDALKKIKEYDFEAKVVMVSAIQQQETILEALRCGALNYIIKPFKVDRLEEILKSV